MRFLGCESKQFDHTVLKVVYAVIIACYFHVSTYISKDQKIQRL